MRWSHDSSYLVTTGGADTSIMVWESLDLEDSVPGPDNGVESDTDSEEEYGCDSDVEFEKNLDYVSKTYTNPLRETSGTKPQSQQDTSAQKK